MFVLPVLYEVLEAPLCGVARFLPLIIHVHQGDVVAAGQEEILTRRVRVDDLVLWSVEDGVVDGQHGRDRQDLLGTLVPANDSLITELQKF